MLLSVMRKRFKNDTRNVAFPVRCARSQEFLRLKNSDWKKGGGQLDVRREQRTSVTRGEGRIKRDTAPVPPDVGRWLGVNQVVVL